MAGSLAQTLSDEIQNSDFHIKLYSYTLLTLTAALIQLVNFRGKSLRLTRRNSMETHKN